jgi:hypothetical protein
MSESKVTSLPQLVSVPFIKDKEALQILRLPNRDSLGVPEPQ